MLAATTDTLPDNTGYVAAAYLVFLVLVLGYVAIMAIRMAHIEQDVVELATLMEERVDE